LRGRFAAGQTARVRLRQNAGTMKTLALVAAALLALPLLAGAQTLPPATPCSANPHAGPQGMPKALPGSANPHAKAAPSPWADFGDYTLTAKVPPKGDTATWKFRTFADPADVVVELDTPAPKGRTKGSIMLLSGQGIATKGFTPEAGYEVDPLDVAIVNLKVLTQLLDAAAPGGPAAVKGKVAVSAREEKSPIIANTPSSNARFLAPWSLKGTVERLDAGTVAFNLELDVPDGEKPKDRVKWTFTGKASGSTKGRVLEDGMSLAGWTAYNLDPKAKEGKKSHSTLKFGTTKLDGPFATVKDLRTYLAKIPPPPPAPSKPMPAKKP
jgi:hypothetical protein